MKITQYKPNLELAQTIREMRGQLTQSVSPTKNSQDTISRGYRTRDNHTPKKSGSPQYDSFLRKYENLENYIDKFSNRDLSYYFRRIAEESGYKYTISNIQKDMHQFKVLREKGYTVREICGMIEFLYFSEQDYLERDRLSPNILVSSWVNTIYADMKLWIDDKYVPRSKAKHQKREYTSTVSSSAETKIGEWE